MKIRNVAVVIENNIQYESFKNAIDIMIQKKINVDIFIPIQEINDGFDIMFNEFYEEIKISNYNIYRYINDKKYEIRFQPYLIPQFKDLNHIFTIKYMYGLTTKPEFSLSLETNYVFDAFLCYGSYDSECLKNYGITFQIGNIKYLHYKAIKNKHQKKLTILYLPTYGDYSSISLVSPELAKIKNDFNILVKPHHGTEYLKNELEIKHREILKSHFDHILSSKTSLIELLNKSDIVITDQSGAIFDALCVKKPVIMYYNKHLEDNKTIPLPIIYAKKGYFISFNDLQEQSLTNLIHQALEPDQIAHQNELFSTLFYCANDETKHYFLKFIDYLENDFISSEYYEFHQLFKSKIQELFDDKIVSEGNINKLLSEKVITEDKIRESMEVIKQKDALIFNINNQLSDFKRKNEEMELQMSKTTQELEDYKEKYNLLNDQFITFQNNIFNSTSWKITKPFRNLSSFLRKK
mgnify:CR=1 FL=1